MLFNRFSKLVKEAFQDDPRFLTARDKVSVMKLKFSNIKGFFNHFCFTFTFAIFFVCMKKSSCTAHSINMLHN